MSAAFTMKRGAREVGALRVAFCLREDATRKPGGDSLQIGSTAAALRALGVSASVEVGHPRDCERFDVLHLTNVDRPHEMLALAERLRAASWDGLLLLNTIHHPDAWTSRIRGRTTASSRALAVLRGSRAAELALSAYRVRAASGWRFLAPPVIRATARPKRAAQLRLLSLVDGCICLSDLEVAALREDFGYRGATGVVPNGVAPHFLESPRLPLSERSGVLVLGRIERRKNSLRLVDVLARAGLPTTFVGQLNPNEPQHGREFLRRVEEASNVQYLGSLPQTAVARLLAQSRLHVLASHAEVFPLVDIEALASGCGVVTTRHSLSRSLIEQYVTTIDPDAIDPGVIRDAYERGGPEGGADFIRTRLTWSAAAETLLGVYRSLGALDPTGAPLTPEFSG